MFGDNSKRTTIISKYAVSMMVVGALLGVSIPWYIVGSNTYETVVAKSSSPIGTELSFNRSNAKTVISNIFTDKNNSVLIVNLKMSTTDQAKLPYKGTDYKVYISSPATDELKSMSILFGRMSTDGDMFLIIPKPTESVYSIFIQNKNYILGTNDIEGKSQIDVADLDEKSIGKALSNYTYNEDGETTNQGTFVLSSDVNDTIAFRLTLKPAFDTKKFKPSVLDANLLQKNADGTEEFDFATFFDLVYKKPTLKALDKEYEKLASQKNQLNTTLRNYQERLTANENDSSARDNIDSVQEKIKTVDASLTELSKKINEYNALEYDDSLFSDLQTKATIVKSQ